MNMPTLAPMADTTAAERQAISNWANNLTVLRANQPTVAEMLEQVQLDLQWTFARDGSLTAMNQSGKWWGGCSVPLLAGRSILKTLETAQTGSCLLAPAHAGLVRAAREKMGTSPVLVVVQPDLEIVRVILSSHDFTDQIIRHRLWLVCGSVWSAELRQLFDAHPGLATPTRFIRTKWTGDDVITPMIATAQEMFSTVLGERSQKLSSLQADPAPANDLRQILLIGGSEFRLWDDAPMVLQQQLTAHQKSSELTIHRFDTDDALNGSPLALLHAARKCGSVISANICRADCNQLIAADVPWLTWITQPAVPTFETAGPRDALVLTDANWRAIARKAGWPENRVRVCDWPHRAGPCRPGPGRHAPALSFICDTQNIEIPLAVKSYSSHRLLWELIEEELHSDPLVVEKIDTYLTDRASQLNISLEVLDRRSFIERLIVPAYQQGLARMMIAEGLSIALHGSGWGDLPEFNAQARGSISSADELESIIGASAGLVYCWPERWAHAMDAMDKPIVHRSGRDRSQLIRTARRVLSGGVRKAPTTSNSDQQLGKSILEMLGV
jgi:hypothetical protein